MNETANSYKCPACQAALRYDAESGLLKCDYCDSEYEPSYFESEDKGDMEADFDWSACKNEQSSDAGATSANGIPAEYLDTIEGTKTYKCKSCGAEIVADETTAATKCPYCDNVLVFEPQLSGTLKPNAIIPFEVDQSRLVEIVKGFYKGKKLLPKNFLNESKIKEIQGIYVPFWLFDTKADGHLTFRGTKVHTWSDSKYNYTKTSYYDIYREGSMAFTKIPVDGSVKMDDALMDSIEPFDYSKLRDFDAAYFSGFLADRFDDDVEASLPRATQRVQQSVEDMFKSTALGYGSLSNRGGSVQLQDTSVKYAMLPVYLIHAVYRGKDYNYAVNGQTGKIVGNLPISKGKRWGYFFAMFFGITFLGILAALLV